nr:MAG TPA: hypothetical protein [Caudoviricetes sp.]
MNELTTINNAQISVKEFSGQRVVTFKDVDAVHSRPDGTAKRNFRSNRDHFIRNEDFFVLDQPDEIRSLGIQRPQGGTPESVTLITESGYLMLVKSFTDDLAWKVQRELVNGYFRVKSAPSQFSSLSPQLQALINIEMRQQEQEKRMALLEANQKQIGETMGKVTAAWTAPLCSGDNWQESATHAINTVVEHFRLNHQMFRREMYDELDRTAGVDLQQRLTRLQNRMAANGATKTQCKAMNKLTIIAQDKKLRSIFESILRRRTLELNARRAV